MNNAILLFHASQLGNNIHPFLLNEISNFARYFDNVYVFCLKPTCSTKCLDQYKNVHVVSISIRKLYLKFWMLLPEIFSYYFWKDVRMALHNRLFDRQYIKKTVMQIIYGRYFSKVADNIIKQNDAMWVVDSYWLAETAYAAARIKKNHKEVVAFSRLHSAEADVERNKYAICQYKCFLDKYLDFIFFVSENGKKEYLSILKQYYDRMPTALDKYIVNRLGVGKPICQSACSTDGVFRVLSCSRIVPLKRVILLAEVFSQWEGNLVEWTHIGDGDEYEKVLSIVENCNKVNVTFNLLGDMSNEQVMKYYALNPVDVFINVSEFEGAPVSVMEALSYGVPVIATDVGGTRELVNSSNGILLNKRITSDNVAQAIKQIMNTSHIERSTMRQNAYNTYLEKLLSDKNFETLLLHIGYENKVYPNKREDK